MCQLPKLLRKVVHKKHQARKGRNQKQLGKLRLATFIVQAKLQPKIKATKLKKIELPIRKKA
jgi:hypothetical protein